MKFQKRYVFSWKLNTFFTIYENNCDKKRNVQKFLLLTSVTSLLEDLELSGWSTGLHGSSKDFSRVPSNIVGEVDRYRVQTSAGGYLGLFLSCSNQSNF